MDRWPPVKQTDLSPPDFLQKSGVIFATFDARTQQSGNVAFGVEMGGRRLFVKTAGDPAGPKGALPHAQRIDLLLNAQRIVGAVVHPALPRLQAVVQSSWGPMLVYDWVDGEVLGGSAERRAAPDGAFQRFLSLPVSDLAASIGTIFGAHEALCGAGWIACDFYDASIIYDFSARRTWLVDVDSYHLGPVVNASGHVFGSPRFMAPEETQRGALIDERTTVFNLGRAISVFLGDATLEWASFRGSQAQHQVMTKACDIDPASRYQRVLQLWKAWDAASSDTAVS